MYDPIIGRFISPDSIVPDLYNPQSLNRYSYCLNNPLRYTDPTGHWWLSSFFSWVGDGMQWLLSNYFFWVPVPFIEALVDPWKYQQYQRYGAMDEFTLPEIVYTEKRAPENNATTKDTAIDIRTAIDIATGLVNGLPAQTNGPGNSTSENGSEESTDDDSGDASDGSKSKDKYDEKEPGQQYEEIENQRDRAAKERPQLHDPDSDWYQERRRPKQSKINGTEKSKRREFDYGKQY
jgi:hypothetical protein